MILEPKALQDHLDNIPSSGKILLAYSGGLDSHVLLHLTSQIKHYSVRALHVHHGLQTVADHWVAHCQKTCHELSIPLDVVHLNLKPQKGESVEQVARQGRYAALQAALQENEILLTAQHQNDQSETLLLQLFRGAGVQGLASMPSLCDFGKGKHARPLLSVSRKNLEDYANAHKLQSVEDPSNNDTSFDRNYLRKEILPQLRQRWLGLDKALNRSAAIQAETKSLLDEIAEDDLKKSLNARHNRLLINKLQNLSHARQKLLLRYWITSSGFQAPSEKKLNHIFSNVLHARSDAQPLIEWQGTQLRRFQNQLYIMPPLSTHDNTQEIIWNTNKAIEIASLNIILEPDELKQKYPQVIIRFRQGGETYRNPKTQKTVSLKKFLAESNIPPWERSRIPLIYFNDKLVQIIGLSD